MYMYRVLLLFLYCHTSLMWSFFVFLLSEFGLHMLTVIRFGKAEAVRSQGETKKGSIRSCSWLVYLAMFCSTVFGLLLFLGAGGRGGEEVGGWLFLQLSGSLCRIVLDSGSLLNRMAHFLVMMFTWCLMGGMDASISRAYVGDVLKAAHISLKALL